MNDINSHFTREEFADRQQRARERMAARDLDGILPFKFEDMYGLTGFDSDGFTIFGCMFLGCVPEPCRRGHVDYLQHYRKVS